MECSLLRLLGILVVLSVGVGGLVWIDFNAARSEAAAADEGTLSLAEYLGGVRERIAHATGSAGGGAVPDDLVAMLPQPPEGWTVRPIELPDVAAFLPEGGDRAEEAMEDLVKGVVQAVVRGADEVAVQTYVKGERLVVMQAIRYPDAVFDGDALARQRFDIEMSSLRLQGRAVMTVRGLDVTEVFLGDGLRARLFVADVGGQIQLRILAPRRLKDADLVPFFERLHVQAMNLAVVDRVDGLGEVPVIAVGSAMGEEERAAYEADRAAYRAGMVRAAEERLRQAEARAAALALEAAIATTPAEAEPGAPAAGLTADCEQGTGGIKRCSVGADD